VNPVENKLQVKNEEKNPTKAALSVMLDVGYIIAMPLVVFLLIGRGIDTKFGTSPLFILIGMGCAAVASTIYLRKKLSHLVSKLQ
jgi:F0F1-type ATP synthase assembly protein I